MRRSRPRLEHVGQSWTDLGLCADLRCQQVQSRVGGRTVYFSPPSRPSLHSWAVCSRSLGGEGNLSSVMNMEGEVGGLNGTKALLNFHPLRVMGMLVCPLSSLLF